MPAASLITGLSHKLDGLNPGVQVAEELGQVADLLASQPLLRRGLTEPNTSAEQRQSLAAALLQTKLAPDTWTILAAAVGQPWDSGADLTAALGTLAVWAWWHVSASAKQLDEAREQLSQAAQIVRQHPDLEQTLSDATVPLAARRNLIAGLLSGKVDATTIALATAAVDDMGERFDSKIDDFLQIAAEVRARLRAKVTVARPMDADQLTKLKSQLNRIYGRDVDIDLAIDPRILGGVRIEIGDDLIDGTVASRLAEAHKEIA
jgi:F-type H+-transporting ATPase subunit delta